jgi:hypothetical protein
MPEINMYPRYDIIHTPLSEKKLQIQTGVSWHKGQKSSSKSGVVAPVSRRTVYISTAADSVHAHSPWTEIYNLELDQWMWITMLENSNFIFNGLKKVRQGIEAQNLKLNY